MFTVSEADDVRLTSVVTIPTGSLVAGSSSCPWTHTASGRYGMEAGSAWTPPPEPAPVWSMDAKTRRSRYGPHANVVSLVLCRLWPWLFWRASEPRRPSRHQGVHCWVVPHGRAGDLPSRPASFPWGERKMPHYLLGTRDPVARQGHDWIPAIAVPMGYMNRIALNALCPTESLREHTATSLAISQRCLLDLRAAE